MAKFLGRSGSLSEALTQRERSILAHLANHRSCQEIAQIETLAPSTVKWYIHQVYAKLGVSNRSEAVQSARVLALLANQPDLPKNNLPNHFSSFIGREHEIEQLLALIQSYPLVTLTGSGGTGKTRLALQAAERALGEFPEGVWFIDLTPLTDPTLVPMTAATALGIHGAVRESALSTLCEMIGRKHMLLVLDNCEHLIHPAAAFARRLLHSCRGLHILATSRETLGLPGEHTLRCPPLTLPDPAEHLSFQALAQYEAVRLFSERAAAVSAGFRLSEGNVDLVLQICRRLDGIPLAIELAAARLNLLSVQQIAARLENIFYLLTGGMRSALPRHKTLKTMIDWSYELLSEPERRLLNKLSVFAGGWTLEAAEQVCADDGIRSRAAASAEEAAGTGSGLYQSEILDLLAQLVDKSLVDIQTGRDGEPRYRLLEMIRQYALNRLHEYDSLERMRERHLDYFRELAVRAEAELRSQTSRPWMERLHDDLPNLRAAMEWSLKGSVVKGLRLAGGLYWFWFGSKYRLEGLDWLDRLLAAEAAGREDRAEEGQALVERQVARGKALNASSYMGILLNRDGKAMMEESAAIFRSLDGLYPRDAAYSFFLNGMFRGDHSLDEALELAHAIDYPYLAGEVLLQKSFQACWAGDLEKAEQYAKDGLEEFESAGDSDGVATFQWELGTLCFMRGNLTEAARLFEASRQGYYECGNAELLAFLRRFPAWMSLACGRTAEARAHSLLQLEESRAMNVPWVVADALGFLAWEALADGDERGVEHYCQEAFHLSDRVVDNLLAVAQYVDTRAALARGDFAQAWEKLKIFVNHNYHNFPPVQLGIQLAGMLFLAQSTGDPGELRLAAMFFGAQDSINPCLMNVIPPGERDAYHAALAEVRARLSPADFDAAWAAGKQMTTLEAIAFFGGQPRVP